MPWTGSVEQLSDHLLSLIDAAHKYRAEITELHDRAVASGGHKEQTLQVWAAHMNAVSEFCELLEQDVQDALIRIAEEDYELRRPNIDDILI